MSLPFHLIHGGSETPSDFASRLAYRNHRDDYRNFCRDFHLDAQGLVDGVPQAIQDLAKLAGLNPSKLVRNAFVRDGQSRRYVFKGEYLLRSSLTRSRVRMCPACVSEDLERGSGRDAARPYRRSHWIVGPLRTCEHHDMALMEIGGGQSPSEVHNTSGFISQMLPRLGTLLDRAEPREPSAFERYVLSRLSGKKASPWLDDFPLYAALHLCLVLGAVARHGPKVIQGEMNDDELWQCEKAGFDIANEGASGIRMCLDELQAPFRERRSSAWIKAMYGRLHDWLAHDCEDPAYDPLRHVITEHALDTLPLGPGDVLFGKEIVERRVHSIRTAARELQIHPKRLRKALKQAGIVDDRTAALSDHRAIAVEGEVAALAGNLKDTLTLTGVQKYLNVPRPHDIGLLEAGFISPMLSKPRSKRGMHYTFRKADLDDFLQRLLAPADPSRADDPKLETLLKAAKRCCRPVMEVVRLVIDNKLERVGRDPKQHGFMSVLVDASEVRPLVVGPAYDGLSLDNVKNELRLSQGTVKALVEHGYIAHSVVKNPVTGWMQPIVSREALDHFKREYVTLSSLARERGIHFRRVQEALSTKGITPLVDPNEIGVTLYSRRGI